MSEENNMTTNSICTTEDAFEKFQAEAMFEEDEYITLSDIVPPQPEVPDISNELNEIPFDNEVVLISTNDDQTPLNSNNISNQHPNNESIQQSLSTSRTEDLASVESYHNEETHATFDNINKNQKRGRRKTKSNQIHTNYQYDSSSHETENNSSIDNQAVQNNVLSTTAVTDRNCTESSNELQEESKYPRRTRRERIPNTSKYPPTEVIDSDIHSRQIKTGKRRGRPKKSSLENLTISEPDSTNDTSSFVNKDLSLAENGEPVTSKETTRKRRRGRPPKQSSQASLEQVNLNNTSEIVDTDLPLAEYKKLTCRGNKKISEMIEESKEVIEHVNTHIPETSIISQLGDSNLALNDPALKHNTEELPLKENDNEFDDDGDDICLSKLKENINNISMQCSTDGKDLEVPEVADFEYHIDKIVKETSLDSASNLDESLLVEDTSKRPNRRKVKQNFKYSIDSEEDPFTNMEISDDDEPKTRKKGKYADDYEYIPRNNKVILNSSSDSELDENCEELKKLKKRKRRIKEDKNTESLSPNKRGRKRKLELHMAEACGEESATKSEDEPLSMKPPAEAWATSNEFENFIAQKIQGSSSLKIKKISSRQKTDTIVPPLEIPVLNQNEPKKSIERATQTMTTPTTSSGVQTSAPYDIPMKVNMKLTVEKSANACAFLNSVVKTTAELGELMKTKSEDFMKKKINTDNVTDTFKMDYCVRKSFLLFKLAKHNLMQMEEDLAKQYDEFLKSNDLSSCREEVKNVAPKSKADSDSDCEIVDVKEVPSTSVEKNKTKLNKTVFLNKELSIKIAKKPTVDKNVEVKGRHTIWINDSVMVKKVKPTQSFLAQDSRNKKPPDYVTEQMVSDFFENYYHQRAVAVCAPYVSTEWSSVFREYACHYFVKCNDFEESDIKNNGIDQNMVEINTRAPNRNCSDPAEILETHIGNPKSLGCLCADVVRRCLNVHNLKGATEDLTCDITDGNNKKGPLSLFRLCYQSLPKDLFILNNSEENSISLTVPPLKSLCFKRISQLMPLCEKLQDNIEDINENTFYSDLSNVSNCYEGIYSHDDVEQVSLNYNYLDSSSNYHVRNDLKSLFSLCIISIQNMFREPENIICKNLYPKSQSGYIDFKLASPHSLKAIAYKNIKQLIIGKKLTNHISVDTICHTEEIFHSHDNSEDFTINCINTMSEEAFHCLEAADEFQNEDDYDYEIEGFDEDNGEDSNEWVSQVQMKVLRSCTTPANNLSNNDCDEMSIDNVCDTSPINTIENEFVATNAENDDQYQDMPHSTLNNISALIKLEPQDDVAENIVDSSIVKTEPVHGLDGMTIIPESIVTKSEIMEHEHNTEIGAVEREGAAYDVNTLDQVVRNKMMRTMDEDSDEEDMFGQSSRRVRREHEPDYDGENDFLESLLIPQTYEPLHIDNAKGVLMESSSDEHKDGAKKQSKKKIEKKKGKQKKGKEITKNSYTKEIPTPTKEVSVPVKVKVSSNEVAVLTRRMREKIRQEEKKIKSSDSEDDNLALSLRKDRKGKRNEKNKLTKNSKPCESSKNCEIQCNNVDSTDQIENRLKIQDMDEFTGFSAIDQNEITSYQKYMQFVYDKIIPTEDDNTVQENADIVGATKDISRSRSPLINLNQPVELLECEPSMPIFDAENMPKTEKQPKKVMHKKKENEFVKNKPKFTERDGWHFYDIDPSDAKLYQKCHIPLEKLPESFVDTYLEYHDITNKDNTDKEVDRLVNLQSLNRAANIKEGKGKIRLKIKFSNSEQNCENLSRAVSPDNYDHFDELTPSEDESAKVEDEVPPPVPLRATENNVAKNSLMDDNESDSEAGMKKIKEELYDGIQVGEHYKPGPKSKTKISKAKVDSVPLSQPLMLTADKMMNKELTLLHAPIVMKEEANKITPKEPSPKDETKPKKRSLRNTTMRDRLKTEDDSSSEEEKQWVSTKEKLLKRIGRKEDAIADDAKRAKLVDDFIERRGEGPDNRRMVTRTHRRSRKKILERLKQQRVLSKELFGEPATDLTPGKRGANVGLFKGRRNIRKVIDKKSLQSSTVLANMEEFDRKRRLNAKLNQLRELLGCEEGVNVLVINDEVCLEYDFQEQRPVVTVHPFFTKVMKAHQYEGVKFMWDACFESLASIETGHGGGGCILAHCMGLGKTLQVLALLHTVLTHPRSGMQRVLVCCPLSTVLNWVDEIHKWIGPVTDQIKVFELSKLKKTYERAYQLEDWYNGGGIFIIGYELFRSLTTLDPLIDEVRPTIINKIRTALLDPGPDIIICDEGHLLKNDCSVLAVAMSRVVTKRRIVLTGTPMQNNLREYYCMVNFVKPNLLGTYSEYSNRFENPIMNGQHRDSREEDIKLMKARTHILHKVLEGCLQRQEVSVLYPYLPKKHEYTVFIPLTKCQWDLYKHYVHHYTKDSKQSVLRDFHILQKIWSHPLVLHNFSTRDKRKEIKAEKIEDDLALEDKEDIKPPATETWWLQYLADGAMLGSIDSSNKFVAVFRILEECIALGDKVLIFSTSLDCLDALEHFLREINGWNLGQEYYRLDGSVPAEVRQKWVREYNAENNHKTKLFLISTRAGCLGLNMTAANRVIILDTSWNPAHDIQSIFRVYRFGQKKDCYIYRLVAMGTMEQKIYERSVTKQAVACRVVDEQQIDRHYNMAELTELYKFDEHGVGVAGGVAVGVGDVALLRVARDAAIHAVHEHDSLLRGSGEQGLPEHERAAVWMQFQQEHAHKQMQNDIETDKAARAEKKLQEQQKIRQQVEQQEIERQQEQVLSIKTEDEPVHNLLLPRTDVPTPKGKGGGQRKGRKAKIVQCRIPIRPDAEPPGPSSAPSPLDNEEMVQKISDILIKHNYTDTRKGPKQIKELVARVNRLTQSGQVSFDGCDELTASIANVLLQRQNVAPAAALTPALASAPASSPASASAPVPVPVPAPTPPALTDVELPQRRRGRPRKSALTVRSEVEFESPMAEQPEPEEEVEVGGRRRRRAALAAELQFDNDDGASQDSMLPDSVIELDDDDWQANSDTDSVPETTQVPIAVKTKSQEPAGSKRLVVYPNRTDKPDVSSILLSDDEPSPPRPVAKPTSEKRKEAPTTLRPKAPTPLHPSLLTNQNFIKIVAHTYLAGNPMLDEDAATLAAQYSTFKLLNETETSGKPIVCGPIYDIACKVLGESVLKKLQKQPSDTKSKQSGESNAASSKMAKFLGQDKAKQDAPPEPSQAPEPSPALVRKRPGPKSRMKKEETIETPKVAPLPIATQQKPPSIIPISLLRRVPCERAATPTPAPPAHAAGECILPDDDDDVRCITEPPLPAKPVSFKVKLPPIKKEQVTKTHMTLDSQKEAGVNAPADKSMATICLDSDDDEPSAPVTAPAPRSSRRQPAQYAPTGGPVPVALTGPDSRPIPLAVPSPAPAPPSVQTPSRTTFYPYQTAFKYPLEPVPISLTGPDNQPVPISLSGPGFHAIPISMGVAGAQATPSSYASASTSMNYVGSDNITTYTPPSSGASAVHPVAMSYSGAQPTAPGSMRTLRLNLTSGTAGSALNQIANNIYLVPAGASGMSTSQNSPGMHAMPPPAPAPQPSPPSTVTKTLCQPGDILRLTSTGKLEIIKSARNAPKNPSDGNVIHTIDDDDDRLSEPVPTASSLHSTEPIVSTRSSNPSTPSAPSAPTPPTRVQNTTNSLLKPSSGDKERRKRKMSSSSSSSDSSRSLTPDPLSILKDVVHIQAPNKSLASDKKDKSKSSKHSSTTNHTKSSSSQTNSASTSSMQQYISVGKSKNKDKIAAKKVIESLTAAKTKKSHSSDVSKSKLAKTINSKEIIAKVKGSIDLTEASFKIVKTSESKNHTKKGGKPISTSKKDYPSYVVGTSKNIVLDGKSKSLTNKDLVDLTGKKYVQVTNVKTIPSSSGNKSNPPETKRLVPKTEDAAPKKKKTEPMTLKDFDIDDIDDIIELD